MGRSRALREVAGGAALHVQVADGTALAQAIQRLVRDPGLRAELAEQGRERARAFTWKRAAERFLDLLRDVEIG